MGKRTSAESPCTSPTSIQQPKRPNFDGILKDEKSRVLTRQKLSKSSSVSLNSPWSTPKHKRAIQMRKSKKEKLAILDSNNDDDENKENNTALIDTLNLSYWKEIHQKQIQQIEQLLADITQATNDHPTKSDFWTTEIDRTNGEGVLFLGKKSKLNQFGDMCNDPKNAKFNVQKEDDLKAFWDGMVYPSVEDFIKRINWLMEAAKDSWSDAHKDKNPNQERKIVTKSKPKPKVNQVKSAEQLAKEAANKKKAEERRAEMRKKMMEMKRQRMQEQS